jgi:hypothetical protein
MTTLLEKGKRIPNWHLKDAEGNSHDVWDYRQKKHLVLLYDPDASKETIDRWQKAIAADRAQWDWLDAVVLIVAKAPPEMGPGAYVIDRYGMFWNYFSVGHWTFDDLERDLVYYEARHC